MATVNCDPAFLATISDPTALANAALSCGGGGGAVGPIPSLNPINSAGTNWAGALYGDLSSGADSVVSATKSAVSGTVNWLGKTIGSLISWKVLLVLLFLAVIAWKIA